MRCRSSKGLIMMLQWIRSEEIIEENRNIDAHTENFHRTDALPPSAWDHRIDGIKISRRTDIKHSAPIPLLNHWLRGVSELLAKIYSSDFLRDFDKLLHHSMSIRRSLLITKSIESSFRNCSECINNAFTAFSTPLQVSHLQNVIKSLFLFADLHGFPV